MKELTVERIADFFDEIQEEYLVPFDFNPNERLPNRGYTYRIKEMFKAYHHGKICIYMENELDLCKARFMTIFRDNIAYIFQAFNDIAKIKIMTDADHYDNTMNSERLVDSHSDYTDTTNNTGNNKVVRTDKTGMMGGNVDAIQLGSSLDKTQRLINTSQILDKIDNKIMDVLDPNIRAYNQSVTEGVNDEIVTISDSMVSNSGATLKSTSGYKQRMGIDAINQLRAHSVRVTRIRTSFMERFNILFY